MQHNRSAIADASQPSPFRFPIATRHKIRPLRQAATHIRKVRQLLMATPANAQGRRARVLDRLILGQALVLSAIRELDVTQSTSVVPSFEDSHANV